MTHQSKLTDIEMIWFDLDQTLLDYKTASHAALVALRQTDDRWVSVPEDRWIAAYDAVNERLWNESLRTGQQSFESIRVERFRLLFESLGLQAEGMEHVPATYLDLYVDQCTCIPGAREVVERLHNEGRRIGIITDGNRELQQRKLSHCQLAEFIEVMVTPDDAGAFKPEPAIFEYASRIVGVHAHRNVCIGDSWQHDIIGAANAGWSAIWFSPTDAAVPVLPTPRICVVHRLEDIPKLL